MRCSTQQISSLTPVKVAAYLLAIVVSPAGQVCNGGAQKLLGPSCEEADFVGADLGQWLWTSRLLTTVVSIHYWKLHSTRLCASLGDPVNNRQLLILKLLIKREAECWRDTFQQVETHLRLSYVIKVDVLTAPSFVAMMVWEDE